MLPVLALVGGPAAGLLIYEAYQHFAKPKLQSLRTVHPVTGVPTQIVVPVTKEQPSNGKAVVPLAPGYNGTAVHVPPPAPSNPPSQVPNNAPAVITPSGGSSLIVNTIADVQRALNTLGVSGTPPLAVDNKLGPATTAKVKQYQGYKGLAIDGVPGATTKAALQADLAKMAATGSGIGQQSAVQQYYDTHSADMHLVNMQNISGGGGSTIITPESSMTAVQHGLNLLGASPALVEDGKAGPKTTAAIKAFQVAHGLAVDGIAGPKVKMAIGLALGAATAPASATDGGDSPVAGEFGAKNSGSELSRHGC